MKKRAASVEETRKRILEATSACHRADGISATGMEDVARRAGVAVGTVYRHFESLENLVDACGSVFMDRFAFPEPEEVAALYEGLETRDERLSRLVDEIAARYRNAAIGFVRVREAKDAFPATAAAFERIEASLDALVDEAVRPLEYGATRQKALRALLDARVWQAHLDQGLDPEATEGALRALVLSI